MSIYLGVPEHARSEWLAMQELIASTGPTPCAGPERDRWTGSTREQAWAADRCLDCPALRACLAYAVVADERGAVWGGLTTKQRASAGAGGGRP